MTTTTMNADQEVWVREKATGMVSEYQFSLQVATACATWALNWTIDFDALMAAEKQPEALTLKQRQTLLKQSRASSFDRTMGVPQFPGGMPWLVEYSAATMAFCSAFGQYGQDVLAAIRTIDRP